MVFFISSDRKSSVSLRRLMLDGEIFAYQRKFPDIENAHGIKDFLRALPYPPAVALIDATTDAEFGEKTCSLLQTEYPEAMRVVLYDRECFKFERFKFFPSSHREIDISLAGEPVRSVSEILDEPGQSKMRSFCHLDLGKDRHSAFYLELPLHLSPAEYRILLFLCGQGDLTVSPDIILGHCFAESYRMVETNVRAHISSINRKAERIGGRKIILSVRDKGYRLNKFM